MNLIKIFLAVLAALVLSACGNACWWPHRNNAPDKADAPAAEGALGSLCAAPPSGGEFCVSSDHDPADAWNQAAAKGGAPIQMWAKWPSGATLDQLIESQANLKAWFADIDKVVAYVRDTRKNAEAYKASLAGHLGALLQQAKDRQAELLGQKPVDAIGDFKKAVSDKADAEKSPLVAALADDKQSMMAVQAIFDKAKGDAAKLKTAYVSVAAEFSAYRATEATETAAYTTLAQQASAASFAALDGIAQAILAAAKSASGAPNDLSLSAMKLSAEIQQFEIASQTAIGPYADFLATHGAALPDMTSSALRSLNAMLGYAQQRVARSDATATSLLNGVAMRKQALGLLDLGQPARDQIAQAELLKAGATFAADASARVSAALQTPPTSVSMKLPYLARRYDQLTALLQMEPLCDPSSSSWREAGCSSLRDSFQAAETSLKKTLPALIQAGLSAMRAKGAAASLLDAAQVKLDAGDVKSAAILYDAAVRGTEEGT